MLGSALLIFNIESASSTPEHCPYDINLTATADCHYKYDFRRLKEIPNCIPNTTKELIFHGNDLTYQPGQLQRFTFLTYLDLSFNGKFTPSCDSFDGLTQLKTLDLNSTKRTHLKPCAFSKLTNLETLSLSCSNMQNVTADIFATLNNLKKLDLSDNGLSQINNNIFWSLPHLKVLYLGYNWGLMLYSNSFMGLSKLEFLMLEQNLMPNATSFPVSVFEPLTQIVEINLEAFCSSLDKYYKCEAIDQRLRVISSLEILTPDNFVINLIGPGFTSLTHLKELNFGTKQPACILYLRCSIFKQ